jgi:hypothetical protein
VVAKHTEELASTAVSPNANCITAEVTPENTVKLYQYVPGQLATMYVFEVKSMTDIEEIENTEAIVSTGCGYIEIKGEAGDIEVYNIQGILISKNEMYINCTPGVYLVKVDNKVTKVLVR